MTSDILGISMEIFRHLWICLCCLQKSRDSQDENLTPVTWKKLAGIPLWYQYNVCIFIWMINIARVLSLFSLVVHVLRRGVSVPRYCSTKATCRFRAVHVETGYAKSITRTTYWGILWGENWVLACSRVVTKVFGIHPKGVKAM